MTLRRSILAAAALAAAVAGCGSGPDYPRDWPDLAKPATRVGDAQCPDLTGTYALPRSVHPRGAESPKEFVAFHSFLGVNGQHPKTLRPPPRMTLQGPDARGLRLVFYDADERVVVDTMLEHGKHFVCKGRWISDAREQHTRANPPVYYGRDVEGRLIGHRGYSGSGVVMLLEVIPLPVWVNDRRWWRLEPAPLPLPG